MRRRTGLKATFLAAAALATASGCRLSDYRSGSSAPTEPVVVPPIEPSNTRTGDSTSGPKETTTDDRLNLSDPANAQTLEIRDDLKHTRPVAWGSWST